MYENVNLSLAIRIEDLFFLVAIPLSWIFKLFSDATTTTTTVTATASAANKTGIFKSFSRNS